MHKLPVFATARDVYSFLWREPSAILRLSWFPTLLVSVVGFFALQAGMEQLRETLSAGKIPPQDSLDLSLWDVISNLVTVVGTSIVAVALHRVILFGDRHPGTFVYLRFGKVEWLFILLSVLALIAITLFAVVFGMIAALYPASTLLLLILVPAIFFLAIRYSLVLPNAVVERRYNFAKVSSLTRGNFWRLVALWLVVGIPAALVFFLFNALLLSGAFKPEAMTETNSLIDMLETVILRTLVLSFPLSIIGGALGVATLSYSYKALSGMPPDAVVTEGAG